MECDFYRADGPSTTVQSHGYRHCSVRLVCQYTLKGVANFELLGDSTKPIRTQSASCVYEGSQPKLVTQKRTGTHP
jgi:hypothetical protein